MMTTKAKIVRRLFITSAQLIFIGWAGLLSYVLYEFIQFIQVMRVVFQ